MNPFLQRRIEQVNRLRTTAEEHLRRVPGLKTIAETWEAFNQDHAAVLAAALSYYTLLSLFPLLLFILAISTLFVESEASLSAVSTILANYLPVGSAIVRSTLQEVTELRGPVTLIAVAGLLWSSSGVFNLVQLSLNRAFCVQRSQPIWRTQLLSLLMVIGGTVLFGLSFLSTMLIRIALYVRFLPLENSVVDIVPPLTGIILDAVTFGIVYRYIPYDSTIRWRDVWRGALLAAVLWEAGKWGFGWYLTNLATLNLVYGSVGAVIAMMLWGYLTATVLLLGAELAAVQKGARARWKARRQWWASAETQDELLGDDGAQAAQNVGREV